MYLHAPLLLFLLSQSLPTNAEFAPHRSIARATERLHKFALRHSAGLARDLRVVFQGQYTGQAGSRRVVDSCTLAYTGRSVDTQESLPNSTHRVYCVRPDNPFVGESTSPASAAPDAARSSATGTATAKGSATSGGTVPASTTAASKYQLVESHVRYIFVVFRLALTNLCLVVGEQLLLGMVFLGRRRSYERYGDRSAIQMGLSSQSL